MAIGGQQNQLSMVLSQGETAYTCEVSTSLRGPHLDCSELTHDDQPQTLEISGREAAEIIRQRTGVKGPFLTNVKLFQSFEIFDLRTSLISESMSLSNEITDQIIKLSQTELPNPNEINFNYTEKLNLIISKLNEYAQNANILDVSSLMNVEMAFLNIFENYLRLMSLEINHEPIRNNRTHGVISNHETIAEAFDAYFSFINSVPNAPANHEWHEGAIIRASESLLKITLVNYDDVNNLNRFNDDSPIPYNPPSLDNEPIEI